MVIVIKYYVHLNTSRFPSFAIGNDLINDTF